MNYSNRRNLKDVFNAFMVNGATFTTNDIPTCPTTGDIPEKVVTFKEAKTIYSKEIRKNRNFKNNSYVCFYEDDQDFDGTRTSVWLHPKPAYEILKHFKGIITPDFSTYQDFPMPLKMYNTYRMRAFGYWYGVLCKKKVINNVRWGDKETWDYCFDGIPKNSIIAIGTVGGSPRKIANRNRFEAGFDELIRRLEPTAIIVYGSSNYSCFEKAKETGIKVYEFQSSTAVYFSKRRDEK